MLTTKPVNVAQLRSLVVASIPNLMNIFTPIARLRLRSQSGLVFQTVCLLSWKKLCNLKLQISAMPGLASGEGEGTGQTLKVGQSLQWMEADRSGHWDSCAWSQLQSQAGTLIWLSQRCFVSNLYIVSQRSFASTDCQELRAKSELPCSLLLQAGHIGNWVFGKSRTFSLIAEAFLFWIHFGLLTARLPTGKSAVVAKVKMPRAKFKKDMWHAYSVLLMTSHARVCVLSWGSY